MEIKDMTKKQFNIIIRALSAYYADTPSTEPCSSKEILETGRELITAYTNWKKEQKAKEREKMNWEINAKKVEEVYGGYVDWEERFYNCPECGEPIYECDWTEEDLLDYLCPVCEYREEE